MLLILVFTSLFVEWKWERVYSWMFFVKQSTHVRRIHTKMCSEIFRRQTIINYIIIFIFIISFEVAEIDWRIRFHLHTHVNAWRICNERFDLFSIVCAVEPFTYALPLHIYDHHQPFWSIRLSKRCLFFTRSVCVSVCVKSQQFDSVKRLNSNNKWQQ